MIEWDFPWRNYSWGEFSMRGSGIFHEGEGNFPGII